jgi:two-component system CheB/CheR fusion protein
MSEPQDVPVRTRKKGKDNHAVVAIGASAGGLEAIHSFFDNMPESINCAFIIIQHLSPDHKSLLVELVGRHTHMHVLEARDQAEVKMNCIYIIPNNKFLSIRNGRLLLSDKPPAKFPNNAIDVFLYSLAEDKKEDAIAIILSGTGTDGTKGLEAIKEAGGFVMVQDPSTAKFDGMPNSAINTGNVDTILSPAEMPNELITYLNEPALLSPASAITDEALEEIFSHIHHHHGHDFHYYKTPTLIRRISRRMVQKKVSVVDDYLQILRKDPEECKHLGKDFLIGVTKFFRDGEAWDVLRRKVIPEIIEQKTADDMIQVWVSACSTGEEAYSMAITIDQVLEAMNLKIDVKVFATDLDKVHIDIAARGQYSNDIEKDVPKNILEKYFTKSESTYTVNPRIRKQIVFARHNITKDPPFIKKDLVTCRNMLIYMNPILQQKVYTILLYSTRMNGYLFLGSSEHPNYIRNHVTDVSAKCKIYRKSTEGKSMSFTLSSFDKRTETPLRKSITPVYEREAPSRQGSIWDEFEQVLSEDLHCSAFYIDHNFEIKKAIGNYSKVLSLPNKDFKFQLLQMIPAENSTLLGAEIKRAWRSKQKIILRSVRFQRANEISFFNIVIKPPPGAYTENLTLITIVENHELKPSPKVGIKPEENSSIDDYVISLQDELQETKYNLQLALEDQETTNEELQSSNEELLSANEELQSSNEELQSVNEELHTLNTEHQLKIRELLELNDDLNNYFRSIDIGQIFLDTDLQIRKFNPASAKMINFIDSDIGRSITHISNNILNEKLVDDIKQVFRKNEVIEKEVQLVSGKNMLMRIMPYLTRDHIMGGVIMSFVDITTITKLNNIIRGVFNASRSAIIALESVRDHNDTITDFRVITANDSANSMFSGGTDLANKYLRKDLAFLANNQMFEKYVTAVAMKKDVMADLLLEANHQWLEITAVKMMDGFVATFTDVTSKKVSDQRLKKNYVELVTVKENLKKLNTDLEQKVAHRTRELTVSEERFRLVGRATKDALWDWDFINNKMWWGETFFTMFGYDPKKDSVTRQEWLNKIHPDDRDDIDKSIHEVINNNQTQWAREYRFKKVDGKYADILDRAYILHDEHGVPYRMLGSMFDLTELNQVKQEVSQIDAQRKFIAESMPLIVWTTDARENVNFANRQFELYTGLSQQDAMGNGWQSVIYKEDLQNLMAQWKKATQEKKDFQTEVRIKLANGEYHWNLLSAKARRENNENLINWVITTIDIHEQKNLNQFLENKIDERTRQLKVMNEALERSNYDLQQFASVASHDLQEPLRKIHMFAHLVKERYVNDHPDAKPYLEKILQSSQRMKAMIASVLNFSKLSANDGDFEWVSLSQVTSEILDDFEIAIEEKGAKIHIGDLPDAQVIPGQIRQVFQNLIGNALKFSKPESVPEVQVESERIEAKDFDAPKNSDGQFVKIYIRDNGIGFEEEFSETVFQLFQRLHSKDKYEGTGIGLAITKKIIEKHSGIIKATSKKGHGTIFSFIIPLKR